MKKISSKILQIANLLGFLLVITFNALANILPLGGRTTGEVSQLYSNLFVPAGYAFSIWGLIYILLLMFVILQARGLFVKGGEPPAYVSRIGWWFVVSCLANAGWLLAWHHLLIPLSLALMLLLLGALLVIYLRLNSGQQPAAPLLVRLPFSVYLGWITVATVANVAALLVSINWNGFGISEVTWTVIVLIVATLITLWVLWTQEDFAYTGVVIWAFVAILVRRQTEGGANDSTIITSIIILLALIVLTVLARFLVKSN